MLAETSLSVNGTFATSSRSSAAVNLQVSSIVLLADEILTKARFRECLEHIMDVTLVCWIMVFETSLTHHCFPGRYTGSMYLAFVSSTSTY